MLESLLSLVPDYGHLDTVYSRYSNFLDENTDISKTKFGKLKISGPENDTLVCFLPWRTSFKEAIDLDMFSMNRNLIIYKMPSDLVNPNPFISRQIMRKIYCDLLSENIEEMIVLSFSVGNFIGFNVANNFPNVKKFISVVPGTTLGTGLYEGIATQDVRLQAELLGYKSHNQYDRIIGHTNAQNQIKNLPQDIEIHLATHDLFIPTKYGGEITKKIQEIRDPKIVRYGNCGHVSVLGQFGKNNSY
jgi:hypothetical protein